MLSYIELYDIRSAELRREAELGRLAAVARRARRHARAAARHQHRKVPAPGSVTVPPIEPVPRVPAPRITADEAGSSSPQDASSSLR